MADFTIVTEPKPEFITRVKNNDTNYTRTSYTCPLCKVIVSKRDFESHVATTHPARSDEAFARLYGLQYPVRCTCGKELHYSTARHGYPTVCSTCKASEASTAGATYKTADDAHRHIEQLQQMIAEAKAAEARLKAEAELNRIPLEQLPLPTARDYRFLRRLSKAIRIHTVNAEREELLGLANLIDRKLDEADK